MGQQSTDGHSTDEDSALRRQSLLIAALCTGSDGVLFALALASGVPVGALASPLLWVAAFLVVIADLALALPARTASRVAVVHGGVRCASALLVWQATGIPDLGTGNAVGLAVAGYRAGAWSVGWGAWAALGALAAGMSGAQLVQARPGELVVGAIITTVANTLLPWLVGRYTTGRAGHIEQVERAAEERRREVREELVRAQAAERGVIARDLHDTISHHVSAIGIHAAAGRLALDAQGSAAAPGAHATGDPPGAHRAASRALDQVEGSSRAAMTDLRRVLDVLAGDDTDGARQPGLADVGALVEGSRRAGLAVELATPGLDPSRLPQSLQLAAYRIVQEVLTNALRHGDGTLHLLLQQEETVLVVAASNAVAAERRPATGSGRGLVGLRRRALVFGGTATSGPSADGRTWCTRADLPLEGP